jgi:phosphatidylethanolamine-binding protein (PEBP) family uncharacterized protein
MKRVVTIFLLGFTALTWAKDQYGRPSLDVPKDTSTLSVGFAEPDKWDGKRIDSKMQCGRLGGEKPASPQLLVTGFPANTESLVVYYANPRAFDNHGTFRLKAGRKGDTWKVPSVRNARADNLPAGVEIFDGGSSWGNAYNAPCPTSGSWLYTVTVYALDANDKVLAVGQKDIGYAP